MNKNSLFFIFVLGIAALNLGTVRKSEDPIRDTQTNPILYEQKKEEEKGGKKGPLMYHVKNYPRETFFIDPPMEKEKAAPGEGFVTEKVPASSNTSDWWEEQPAASQATSTAEKISEPQPEPALESGKFQDPEAAEQPAAMPAAENTPSGKGDDSWW